MRSKIAKRCTEAVASIPALGTMKMITLVLAGLLGLFIWYVLDITPQQDNLAPVEISMSSAGYTPVDVAIVPGTEVVFYNTDSEDFWPATNNHPTHTLYDGTSLEEHCSQEVNTTFDACQPIRPGETWSFTFTKPGTFTYHDHLWPHLTGTITVNSDTLAASGTDATWTDWFLIFPHHLTKLIATSFFGYTDSLRSKRIADDPFVQRAIDTDPSWAIYALRSDSASSSELLAHCHEILHDIGKEAYYQYGSFESASVFQSDFCNSGYIHGIFEAYFEHQGDLTTGLSATCQAFSERTGHVFDQWQCQHGVGHGLMYHTGGQLNDSIELCQTIFSETEAIKGCQNGVYMEIFNTEVLANEDDFLDPDDPFMTCRDRTEHPQVCYHYIPAYLSQVLKIPYAAIFELCETATSNYRDSCKSGVSVEAMKRSTATPETVFALCAELRVLRDQVVCVAGAVDMYVNQTASIEDSYRLCNTLTEVYRTICQSVVDLRVSDFGNKT